MASLTGRFWFRRTWSGRLVLLVEERRPRWFGKDGAFRLRWRDAKLLDFAEPSMRPLLSLEHSFRPEQPPLRYTGPRVVASAKVEEPPAPKLAAAA